MDTALDLEGSKKEAGLQDMVLFDRNTQTNARIDNHPGICGCRILC